MKKLSAIICISLILFSTFADARGRRGSHRVGGTNSHGKHSHYLGGH